MMSISQLAFNPIDMAAAAVVLFGLVAGLLRGTFGELLRLFNALVVSFCALRFYRPFGELLASNARLSEHLEHSRALAFVFIVVTVGMCLLVARILVQLVAKMVITAKKNRAGGGILGAVRGVIVVFLVLFGVSLWPRGDDAGTLFTNSIAAKGAMAIGPSLVDALCGIRVAVEPTADEGAGSNSGASAESAPTDH